MEDRTSLRVATYIGPVPFGSMDVDIGSDRPSNFAFEDIRDPMRPPPMTMVSSWGEEEEDSSVVQAVDVRDDDAAAALLVEIIFDGEKASAEVWRFAIASAIASTTAEIAAEILVMVCDIF
jgi:hypothetical protein